MAKPAPQPESPTTSYSYEYSVVSCRNVEERLAAMAAAGWRLHSILQSPDLAMREMIFERPR